MGSCATCHKIQLIILGDYNVGKSSLLLRFTEDKFGASMTLGVDIKIKTIQVNKQSVRLLIWDTAGQERFRFLTKKQADGIVLVYDVTSKISFDNIKIWLNDIRNACLEGVKIILVGTKTDKVIEREVMTSDGEKIAKEFDLHFIEASSKYNEKVNEMFHLIASQVLLNQLQDRMVVDCVKLQENVAKKKKTSC